MDGRVKLGHDEKVQSHAIMRGFTIREQCRKPPFAVAGEIDDAAARRAIARGPFQFGEARHHGGAQRAGEVMAPFAPVETGLAYRAARMRQHVGRYLQGLLQKSFALRGQFDLVVEVVASDRRELLDLTNRMRAIEGVVTTETFFYLEMWKQLYDWGTRR